MGELQVRRNRAKAIEPRPIITAQKPVEQKPAHETQHEGRLFASSTVAQEETAIPRRRRAQRTPETRPVAHVVRAERAANVVRDAAVRGHPDASASLLFNPSLQRMNRTIAAWEQALRAQGLEVEICLGAGDLRRALLHVSADGPGDVELFIHFHNHDLERLGLDSALAFLAERGVHVERDLQQIFGEEKKLDIFVKDQKALAEGLPYRGEFGAFEGMGDTTINALLYSPTKNEVWGNPGDLAALAEGRIGFLELAKSAKLEEPKKITGTKALTEYPATILRLALRCLRLEIDLALAPNPNRLRMDESFDVVLRGFEHYFAGAQPEGIAKYALDEKYVEQFLKIFRKRSDEDLAAIRALFAGKYAATAEVLRSLGLDLDALTSPDPLGRGRDANELRAVLGNARYDALRPFVERPSMRIEDPFASAAGVEKLLAPITLRGVDRADIRAIPPAMLERYSAKLAARVQSFAALDVDTKLDTLHKYEAAVKMFAGKATARLFDQVTFAQTHFESFSFLDTARLQAKDPRALLRFLEDELAAPAPSEEAQAARAARADALTAELCAEIEAKIDAAMAAGQRPVVFVDLDGTLYSYASRYAHVLQRYDATHGTAHFADLDHTQMPEQRFEELLYRRLAPKIPDVKALEKEIEAIKTFVALEIGRDEALLADVPNLGLIEKLQAWAARGAELVALTARFPWQRNTTMDALARDGVKADGVFVGGAAGATYTVKTEAANTWLAEHPGATAVALVDNDPRNVLKVSEGVPGVTGAQFLWRETAEGAGMWLTRGSPRELYEVLGGRPV